MKHQLLLIVQLMCTSVACQIVNGDVSIPWDRQFVKYRAAVVEYSPVDSESAANPRETILRNIQHFSQLLTQASQIGTDIIVFPEYGMTTLTTSSMSRYQVGPFLQLLTSASGRCNDTKDVPTDRLVTAYIGCLARKHSIYVVVNIGEKVPCSSTDSLCPSDGAFHYNTNAVFDRQGRLVARYRKEHLYLEPGFETPPARTLVTFSTDFGVEFCLLTCFDILYRRPYQCSDYVLTTAWYDELPFLTALQFQEGWSRAGNVNLLASGYHRPTGGQFGSGIYAGVNGPISYTKRHHIGTQMIIENIVSDSSRNSKRIRPKTSPLTKGEEIAHWPLIYEDLSSYFTTELLMGQETVKQCHMNLCCSFNYRAYCDYGSSCPPYRLITFSGTRTVGRGSYRLGIEVCAVVACLNESVASCGRPSDKQQLLFESLEITGNFSGQAVYPTAITQRLEMVEKYEFHIARDEPQRATWKAPPNLPDLLSAGLFGRLFHLDT